MASAGLQRAVDLISPGSDETGCPLLSSVSDQKISQHGLSCAPCWALTHSISLNAHDTP